jgi:hypothetical protein
MNPGPVELEPQRQLRHASADKERHAEILFPRNSVVLFAFPLFCVSSSVVKGRVRLKADTTD